MHYLEQAIDKSLLPCNIYRITFMGAAFFITLREGLEAALIITVVLAYLRTLGRKDQFKFVFSGSLLAVIASIIVAVFVYFFIGRLEGAAKAYTEGIISLVAAFVLTWMVFWMKGQSKAIGKDLRRSVDIALSKGSVVAVASIVFLGVLREGIETGLFLLAIFFQNKAVIPALGVASGLLGAGIIGYLVYAGSKLINLKLFFRVTAGFIILVGAGMLSNSIHAFQELGIVNVYLGKAWNLSGVPIIGSGVTAIFLKGIIGWKPDPSVGQAFVWTSYLVLATWFYYFSDNVISLTEAPKK